MKKRSSWTVREAFSVAGGLALLLAVLFMLAGMLFVGPISFVVESVELISLSTTSSALVQSVEVSRGRRGTEKVGAQFVFEANGVEHRGSRVSPGFSDWSYSTGRSALARELAVGGHHPVYFNPGAPEKAVLFYGWNKTTLVVSAIVLIFGFAAASRTWPVMREMEPDIFGVSFLVLVALLVFGPPVVAPLTVAQWVVTALAVLVAARFLPARWRLKWSRRGRARISDRA